MDGFREEGERCEGVGVPPRAGYSSVPAGSSQSRWKQGDGDGEEYPEVPGAEKGHHTPQAEASADAETVGREAEAKPDPDDFWQRMVATGTFKTVEQARNALDRRDWKEVERAKRLAERVRSNPGREVADELGRVSRRSYRQVNVKLSEPDFLSLKALAIERDMPPATAARVLLRQAIAAEAGG